MKLSKLLVGINPKYINGKNDFDINNVICDSRKVGGKDLFVAVKGVSSDGHSYIQRAIDSGAIAIVHQDELPGYNKPKNVTFAKVGNARKALAVLASNYYSNSHKKMKLVGVTGTNGKTTTCELTFQLLSLLHKRVGLISTVSAKFSHKELDTGYHVTTPDALDLHKLLYKMHENGCDYVIIETTSHGIDQHRTHGLRFELGAVTNITPEHLDYHKTFNNYLKTKAKLFKQSEKILLNKYDPSLTKLLELVPSTKQCEILDYKALDFPEEFRGKFPGQYNLENASLAHAIVQELTGVDTISNFSELVGVEGRMEFIDTGRKFKVVVDFAHDAAALGNILQTTRKFTDKKLIVVFGCAGLRDRLKRPKMGGLAIKLADKVVITAEDPRTEKLSDILQEIETGAITSGGKKDKDYYIIEDRQDAINFAINKLAKEEDLVLITGKGHEKSMCFGTTEFPWSDQKAVIKALRM